MTGYAPAGYAPTSPQQPGYPGSGYGQPGYPPAPPRRGPGRVIALIAGIVALLLVVGAGAYWFLGRNRDANGVEALSADEILSATKTAAASQGSVHLVMTSSGAEAADLTLVKGAGGFGSFTDEDGTVQMVATSDTLYLKASAATWEEQFDPDTAALIGDRWVSEPVDEAEALAELSTTLDFDAALDDILSPDTAVTKGPTGDVDGRPAVSLNSSDGTLWVATTGPALPLQITGDEGQQAQFRDWGAPVTVQPPPADQVVSIEELAQDASTTDPGGDTGGDIDPGDAGWGDQTAQVTVVGEYLTALQNGDVAYAESLLTPQMLNYADPTRSGDTLDQFEIVSAEPTGDAVGVTVEEVWNGSPLLTTYFVISLDGVFLIDGSDSMTP